MEQEKIVNFIRKVFKEDEGFVALHQPFFGGNEKKYLNDTIDSTYVSSVGKYVTLFEEKMAQITGAKHAIAIVNGTTALHLALVVAGVEHGDEVITQPLTFVATANAIVHAGGIPVFVDVDTDTMGMSPQALSTFLNEQTFINNDRQCINKTTGKRIAACLPMHTFGFPLRIDEIAEICAQHHIALVEDAAESLGSYYKGRHTGTIGLLGTFSFNGNKTVTCGGGGAIITNNDALAKKAKGLSTTAKVPHPWEFVHNEVAYNYRMPNLNAALACAQLEQLNTFLANKKDLADMYSHFFAGSDIQFFRGLPETQPNYWLNAILFKDASSKEAFLEFSNTRQVMTRPIWKLMTRLPMFATCQHGPLTNAEILEEKVVNLPSSFRFK